MSFADFKDNTMRAVVSKTIDGVLKYVNKHDDRTEALLKLTDLSEKLMGDKFEKKVFDGARNLIHNPDAKWMKYTNKVLDEIDPHVAKMHALNLGYQAGFYGYSKTCEFEKEHGYRIPWIILMDPTSACNMHCTGCWAAEYGHRMSLSYEDLDSIVTQGEKLGIYFYMMTGGEPLMRKKDIVKLAEKHNKCMFYAFTNGTLIDEEFCKDIVIINKGDVVLSGDLDNIKREFGKNQLVVSAVDKTLDDLENIINEHMSDILEITGRTKEELIIKNVADVSRKQILSKFISENIEIERFETYKPSLNDIFVSKVGDADEKEAAE